MPRCPPLLLIALAVALLLPAVASASEVRGTLLPPQGRDDEGTTVLTLVGTPVADDVEIVPQGPPTFPGGPAAELAVRDPAGVIAVGTCRAVSATEAACPLGALRADMGPGDDRLAVSSAEATELRGGPGDDVLRGGPGGDVVVGGPGADVLSGGSPSSTYDRVSYADSDLPVHLDGEAGTVVRADGNDRVEDFGTLEGGAGADSLVAPTRGGLSLLGGGGDDRLVGGSGPDALDGGRGSNDVRGAGGDDVVRGSGRIEGGPGDDVVRGRSTDDVLSGGPGQDDVRTNGGDDRVDLADGQVDRLDCTADRGPAGMRVRLDAGDGTRACGGLRRSGPARPAFFGPAFEPTDYFGTVGLGLTCPQPLRDCSVLITLRRSTGALAMLERLVLDRQGLDAYYDVLLDRPAQAALRRAGRLALVATLQGRDAAGRPVRSRRRFVLRASPPPH